MRPQQPGLRPSDGQVIVVDGDRIVLGEITADTERPTAAVAFDMMDEGRTTVRAANRSSRPPNG